MNGAPMCYQFAPILVPADDVADRLLYLMNVAPMRQQFARILVIMWQTECTLPHEPCADAPQVRANPGR
jgi:hypothetical protein